MATSKDIQAALSHAAKLIHDTTCQECRVDTISSIVGDLAGILLRVSYLASLDPDQKDKDTFNLLLASDKLAAAISDLKTAISKLQ